LSAGICTVSNGEQRTNFVGRSPSGWTMYL
jgi:hypothetical protein